MKESKHDLIVKVRNIKDLLMVPQQDPFSDYEPVYSGEAALPRAIRRRAMIGHWNIRNLIICLPSDQAKMVRIEEIRKILKHYIEDQFKRSKEDLFVFRCNGLRILRNGIIFLMVCMSIATLIGVEKIMPNLSPLMRTALVEAFTVIGWVVLWRPIELILSDWAPMKIVNKIYHKLLKANITIQSY